MFSCRFGAAKQRGKRQPLCVLFSSRSAADFGNQPSLDLLFLIRSLLHLDEASQSNGLDIAPFIAFLTAHVIPAWASLPSESVRISLAKSLAESVAAALALGENAAHVAGAAGAADAAAGDAFARSLMPAIWTLVEVCSV